MSSPPPPLHQNKVLFKTNRLDRTNEISAMRNNTKCKLLYILHSKRYIGICVTTGQGRSIRHQRERDKVRLVVHLLLCLVYLCLIVDKHVFAY